MSWTGAEKTHFLHKTRDLDNSVPLNGRKLWHPSKAFWTATARVLNCNLIKAGTNQTGLPQGMNVLTSQELELFTFAYHKRDNLVLFSLLVPKSCFTFLWAKRKYLHTLQIIPTSHWQKFFRRVCTSVSCPLTLQRHLHSWGGRREA